MTMPGGAEIIVSIIVSLVLVTIFILITRLLGAWMLRINEIIRELKEIKYLLKKNNDG